MVMRTEMRCKLIEWGCRRGPIGEMIRYLGFCTVIVWGMF
jgi:hypothetical protein